MSGKHTTRKINIDQYESIHDMLERIKVLEIKMGLVHKRNEEMVEVALEAVKARFMKIVEKYIEDFLATHLAQLMEIVKDIHEKVDTAVIAATRVPFIQQTNTTLHSSPQRSSQVMKPTPKIGAKTVEHAFSEDLLETPIDLSPVMDKKQDLLEDQMHGFHVLKEGSKQSSPVINKSFLKEEAKDGLDLDDDWMGRDESK